MLDVFGNELFIDDVVVYADKRLGTNDVALDMYIIREVCDGLLKGEMMNGDFIGECFYLEDTKNRAALITNVYKAVEAYKWTTVN